MENKKRKSVIELLDGSIKELREAGYSLEHIGKKGGVTKERMRQVIKKYYPGIKPKLPTERQVAKMLVISPIVIVNFRNKGLIKPTKFGPLYRYDKKTINQLKKLLKKVCRICGKPLNSRRRTLCENCSSSADKPMNEADLLKLREKRREYVKRYRKNHKEQNRLRQRTDNLKYIAKLSKLNFQVSIYEVKNPDPAFRLGERFQAAGFKNSRYLLSDGRSISVLKVIKVSGPKGNLTLKKLTLD